MDKNDIAGLSRYLSETLGITVIPTLLTSTDRLPFFLHNSYALFEIKILDCPLILAADQNGEEQSPAMVRKHMDSIRMKYGEDVVYVRSRVTAYNRKRLIKHRVPFIVPENQMYLPMLGIELREYYKKMRTQPVTFTPSTQVVAIYLCTENTDNIVTPAKVAGRLGYSAMTLTRAFDELEVHGIGHFFNRGRERCIEFSGDRKAIWEKVMPILRNPVKKRCFIRTKDKKPPGLLSGLSALAHYSMLAEPNNPVRALSSVDWKQYVQNHKNFEAAFKEPDTFEIELWAYDPLLLSSKSVVDKLSLYMSLKDTHDERIESALDHMMKEITW
jgi:hypothetical protein